MSRRQLARIFTAGFALAAALALLTPPASGGEAEGADKLPRFVSLRSDLVNLRVGPGENYPIEWVLTHKEMPVEIIKEFEHWRKVHDWQGTEGWVHERMVWSKRNVAIKGGIRALHQLPDPASEVVARAEPGVFAHLIECRGAWCRIEAAGISGWVMRSDVWGVYPDEAVQ